MTSTEARGGLGVSVFLAILGVWLIVFSTNGILILVGMGLLVGGAGLAAWIIDQLIDRP